MLGSEKRIHPRCIIIAGPNGSGKTTFAREFLPQDAGIIHFVNADLIAFGLSPLKPELARLEAGKLFLCELDRLAKARVDFGFESTLSGLSYARRLRQLKKFRISHRIDFSSIGITSACNEENCGSCKARGA